MAWTKYNNPNKRKYRKKISRTDADLIAIKNAFDDKRNGIDLPLTHYDHQSDVMCGNPSRNIYN